MNFSEVANLKRDTIVGFFSTYPSIFLSVGFETTYLV